MSNERSAGGSQLLSTADVSYHLPATPRVESRSFKRNVIALSLASFFSAVRSEMITPLRMVFLVTAMQTPLPIAGLIEGIAQGVGGVVHIAARRLPNRDKAQKGQVLLGYGISNAVKPLLAVVMSWPGALLLTFLDTVGQGIRRDPLNKLIEGSASRRGTARVMGPHEHSSMLGATIGALVSTLLLLLLLSNLQAIFAWAAVPGILALLTLLFVRTDERRKTKDEEGALSRITHHASPEISNPKPKVQNPKSLGVRFWMFLGISTLFALGNVSVGFFVLRLASLEKSLAIVVLAYFGHKMVATLLAPSLGKLHERWGPLPVLITCYVGLGLLYAGWVFASQAWMAWVLLLLYGAYTALSLGVHSDLITDLVPGGSREVALDWHIGLTGLAVIAGNVTAAWFWIMGGPPAAFMYGALTVALAVALIAAWVPWLRRGYAA
ncbi:MAG TPA: MFS transporter [Chloroflexia bacterium]|nr:MFS transporter [Chloroflexia bacterium]